MHVYSTSSIVETDAKADSRPIQIAVPDPDASPTIAGTGSEMSNGYPVDRLASFAWLAT